MHQESFAKVTLVGISLFTLAACGSRDYRPDFVEQACDEEGSVYWISLVSYDGAAKRDAILADPSSEGIVKRANAILEPTEIKLVFTHQGVSFHGFSPSALAVDYKNVTYLRMEDRDGNPNTLVIDYIRTGDRGDSEKETTEQGVSGLSPACIDGLQDYLAGQGVTLST